MISSVATPVRQLKAFEKVPVRAGEKVTVRLEVPFCELMFTNERMERVLEPGEFEVQVGARPTAFISGRRSASADALFLRIDVGTLVVLQPAPDF